MNQALPPCQYCGSQTEFETLIHSFGDEPGARVYRCVKCRRLTWVEWWVNSPASGKQYPARR